MFSNRESKKHFFNKKNNHECSCHKKQEDHCGCMNKHDSCHCGRKHDSFCKPETLFTPCGQKHDHCEHEHNKCHCHCECKECVEIICFIKEKHCPHCGW